MACYISTAGCRGGFFYDGNKLSNSRSQRNTKSLEERTHEIGVRIAWAQTERGVFLALGLTRLINSQPC